MQQTAFFLQWNGKWRVVIVDQGRALGCRTDVGARGRGGGRAGGLAGWRAGARSQALAAAARGPLMCRSWWELKTALLIKSTPARSFSGGLPRANRARAALFISALTDWFLPSAPGPQWAPLSLKLSESERWRGAWKAVTLQKSTSNKQLEHADAWG